LRARRSVTGSPYRHDEGTAILFTIASNHCQQVRTVWNRRWQKHDQLRVGRANDRHQVALAPDLWRLRSKRRTLDGQRLIDPIDRRAKDHELIRTRSDGFRGRPLLLGVGEFRHQNHDR
jgi:hypothetical protein